VAADVYPYTAGGSGLEATIPSWAHEGGSDALFARDLVLEGGGRRVMGIDHMMTEPDVELAMRQRWTSIGSDAGAAVEAGAADLLGLPHPCSDGTFPRILARYVRERGTLALEDAIRKMTSWPATRMRLDGRGLIKEGLWADGVIFHLARVQDLATYEEPTRYPGGIDYVIVNGEVAIDGDRHTGVRAGQVLCGPGRQ